MKNRIAIIFLFFFTLGNLLLAQNKSNKLLMKNDTLKNNKNDINPIAPAKAAFYSAILPGLGQAYNKKYWKIPLVYASLGVAVYSYINSNNKYQQFRDVYKNRLEGRKDDDLSFLSDDRLIAGQKFYQRNKDLSSFFIVGIYILNIIEANVNAHLMQFNVNNNLTIRPDILKNEVNNQQNVAITFCIQL